MYQFLLAMLAVSAPTPAQRYFVPTEPKISFERYGQPVTQDVDREINRLIMRPCRSLRSARKARCVELRLFRFQRRGKLEGVTFEAVL